MGPVGRADFDQLDPGAAHDLRHAEGAADFDQFAARDDRFASLGQGVEDEEDGRGVVVDEGGVLSARHFAEQRPKVNIAFAAAAGCQVELKRDRVAHG